MPKRKILNPMRVHNRYAGLTDQTRPEAEAKANGLTNYYNEQQNFIENLSAINRMRNRNVYHTELERPGDVEEALLPGWNNTLPDLKREMGYKLNSTYLETVVMNSAEEDFAENSVNDFEGLKKLFVTQGILSAEMMAEMARERQRFLAEFPEDDPDREQKADYLVVHGGGAYKQHNNLQHESANVHMMTYESRFVYEDFQEAYEQQTGKPAKDASLREVGEFLNISEKNLPAFFSYFQSFGDGSVTEKDTMAQAARKTGKSEAYLFSGAFAPAMVREGVDLIQPALDERTQALVEEGKRYRNEADFKNVDEGSEAFKTWAQQEGRSRAIRELQKNCKNVIREADQTIIRNPERVAVFKGNVKLSMLSELPQDVACNLVYSKQKQLEKKLVQDQNPEHRKKLAAEYLVCRAVGPKLDAGDDCRDYTKDKLEAMAGALLKNVVEKLPPESQSGKALLTALQDEDRLQKAAEIEDEIGSKYTVSYDKYIKRHTGENMGKTPKELCDNLAKSMAAYTLQEANKPFDLKHLHKMAEYMKELYSLDTLQSDPEKLRKALQNRRSVIKAGGRLRDGFYGVSEDQRASFCADMKKLSRNMVDPEGHSKEYRTLCDRVQRAAELETTTAGMSEKKRAEAYRQANIDVMEAAMRYGAGKEKVRHSNEGKACFANALDAVSVVAKHTSVGSVRAQKWVDEINRIRKKPDQQIGNLQKEYGAERAQREVFKPRKQPEQQVQQGMALS